MQTQIWNTQIWNIFTSRIWGYHNDVTWSFKSLGMWRFVVPKRRELFTQRLSINPTRPEYPTNLLYMLLTLYVLRKRHGYVGALIMKAVLSFETSLYGNPRDALWFLRRPELSVRPLRKPQNLYFCSCPSYPQAITIRNLRMLYLLGDMRLTRYDGRTNSMKD